MRTVLLTSSVDRREPGGVQAVMDGLCERLGEAGVRVVDVRSRPVARLPLADRPWARPALARCARQFRRARLAWLLLRHRPDVVNYHFASGDASFFLRLRRLFGYRLVVSTHGSDVLRPEEPVRRRLQRILSGADAVTAVSRDLRDVVLATPGVAADRVHLIPNGIDTRFWTPDPHGAQPPEGDVRRLVAIGRIEPVKGFDLLIDALARLHARGLAVELTLIGDGVARAALEAQAQRLGVRERVRFTGFLDAAAVRAEFRSAELFAMPSRSEGMPLALLEAMACGLPPVAARVGGIPEILRGTSGRLVPPEDPQALADALERALGDADGDVAARTRGRAEDFSSSAVDRAYLCAFRLPEAPGPERCESANAAPLQAETANPARHPRAAARPERPTANTESV